MSGLRARRPARARRRVRAPLLARGPLRVFALCCALATGLGVPAASEASAPTRASLPAIERQVMCVTCKIPLNVAESTQANDERAYIRELIAKGYDEARVKDALVAQYGPTVLGLPRAQGFDLTVYLVPALVVLALLAAVAVLLPRWRSRAREQRADGPPSPELSGEEREHLERDMARFD